MTQVWIGCSETLESKDLITRYLDPYFTRVDLEGEIPENPQALLETEFGAGEIDPGTFEVYDRTHYPNDVFDAELFAQKVPFSDAFPGLQAAVSDKTTLMFFVTTPNAPLKRSDEDIRITDVLDVTFDWDKPR